MATYDDFAKIDMRVGKIIAVEEFPRAMKPTYKVHVDFGDEIGTKWSSVQAKKNYTIDEMMGRYVIAVVNFPPKNIAGFMSEVLILGVPTAENGLSLLAPTLPPELGGRVY